eukprot:CAMPEP_0173187554 /NCGR_PEP_ID=MMETSP1141-20130122/10773_1 /TAXON_ID=483371 /ORGANISM="non described non described, Strain CCMP2298" /LENGTH=226 /DNA_ID=CAMNT_0014111403 /DNA_START=53 /DNA_END=730 /DNA_ORIENTATION=+
MTLRFVKTSILSSEDGIDFDKETAVESEEVLKARREAEASSNKPLYQQLADIQARKQEEYDANTKAMKSSKGLDEEDIAFFEDLEATKARHRQDNKRHDDEELESFRQARRIESLREEDGQTARSKAPGISLLPSKKVEAPITVGIKIKAKRKVEPGGEGESSNKKIDSSSSIGKAALPNSSTGSSTASGAGGTGARSEHAVSSTAAAGTGSGSGVQSAPPAPAAT